MRRETDMEMLAMGMVIGGPAAIKVQEARGQQAFVHSDLLPTNRSITDEQLTALGFVLGEQVKDDKLFQAVTFPPGWTKAATSHSMHSDIRDDKKRRRFGVFYKAAFYDRSASLNAVRRYTVSQDWDMHDTTKKNHITVMDCDQIIKRFDGELVGPEINDRDGYTKYVREREWLEGQARAWLSENYPNHEDVTAYW